MPLAIPNESSGSYEKCPEGNHVAVCCSIIDLGTQHSEKYNTDQRKILIEWEVSGEAKEDGTPFYIDQIYTFSMNEKAALRRDLESWRGVKFSKEDFGRFELSNVLGVGCMLNVVWSESGDKVYANIASIARLPKGMATPDLVARKRCLSLEPGEFDSDEMAGLRDGILAKIKESPEFRKLTTGRGVAAGGQRKQEAEEATEDEIPF
jgi:hypothetical protein